MKKHCQLFEKTMAEAVEEALNNENDLKAAVSLKQPTRAKRKTGLATGQDGAMIEDIITQYGAMTGDIITQDGAMTGDIITQVVKLAKDIGVNMATADLSVSHRLGRRGRGGRPRTIIAKFVRRQCKNGHYEKQENTARLCNLRERFHQ